MDRRTIRTKRAIINAFAELLTIKDINEITIKEVADLADINRKTFYRYYSGTHEIIEEIENEIVSAFEKELRDISPQEAMTNPYALFTRLTAILNRDIDFYGNLFRAKNRENLSKKLAEILKGRMIDYYSSDSGLSESTIGIAADFIFSGMLAVYRNWFHSDRSQPIEEISQTISVLCFQGINGLRGIPSPHS